ncbi:TetR/AcrR family transcriptional regulator [Gordonia jinhuaensis]|uniref:TetR/AcrR family transcriptional regulator n=1 Tax=Gordonia jinhuaensis TaxID=1517702 RepID=UPI001667A2A1|nr:TetR/AcrR family transcriptional regulator [Gordonia jinhuaensis]
MTSAQARTHRVPQQDRSRNTRRALLAATVSMLAEEGWAATTVAAVAARAGVSRGAAQHHFPTREALITATLEQLFTDLTDRVNDSFDVPAQGAARVHRVVEYAVEIYTGTEFKAALQVWAAAASDPALRELIRPLELRLARAAHQMTMAALGADPDDENAFRLVQATLDLARGLGLADTLSDDSARRAVVVETWSQQMAAALFQ